MNYIEKISKLLYIISMAGGALYLVLNYMGKTSNNIYQTFGASVILLLFIHGCIEVVVLKNRSIEKIVWIIMPVLSLILWSSLV